MGEPELATARYAWVARFAVLGKGLAGLAAVVGLLAMLIQVVQIGDAGPADANLLESVGALVWTAVQTAVAVVSFLALSSACELLLDLANRKFLR